MAWQTISSTFEADTELFYSHDRIRFRPTAVRGFVSGPFSGRSRTVSTPLAAVGISDNQPDGKIPHTEAGHLIALELGGADSSYNLVPMYGGVNRGTYRALEGNLGKRIVSGKKPAILVRLGYPELKIVDPDDCRIPAHFDVYFYPHLGTLAEAVAAQQYFVGRIPNLRLAPARMTIDGADIELRRKLIEIKGAFAAKKWKIEDAVPEYAGKLPPLDQRPNAWLDHLIYTDGEIKTAKALLAKVPDGLFTVGPGWGFAPQQRFFLELANRLTQPDERKGECWSDAGTNDPIKTALTALGTDDGIQVDHIYPEASGGPNVYSNAAVTSALYNKQKGR